MNKRNVIITIIMTFFAGLFAGNKWCKTKYYLKAKEVTKELLINTAESICPCELILVMRYNQQEESTITDFSQYKDKKRVGLIINKTGPSPQSLEQEQEDNDIDLDDDIIIYPHAVVYRIGETWLWKVL